MSKYEGKAYKKLDLMPGDKIINSFMTTLVVLSIKEAKLVLNKWKYDPDLCIYGREIENSFNKNSIYEWGLDGFRTYYDILERKPRTNKKETNDPFCPVCGVKGEWVNFGIKCPKCWKILG